MKKSILSLLLACVMLAGLFPVSAMAAGDDVLMIYDAETYTDVGGVYLGYVETEYFTQGKASFNCNSVDGFLEFFADTYTYWDKTLDVSGYEYIEFDIMSWEDLVCDFNFAVVENLLSHHGNDYQIDEIFMPAGEFVHFKLPISQFVTYSPDNLEPYDQWHQDDSGEGWEVDDLHYGAPALDRVARIRFQFAFCRVADEHEEPFEDPYDRVYPEGIELFFDNVTATKNGAGSDSTLQMWSDVKAARLAAQEPAEPDVPQNPQDPQEPVDPTTTPTDVEGLGDVNGDGNIDAKDALAVLKISVGKLTATEEESRRADVNRDEKIDAKDALEILKYTVGKPSCLAKAR